MDEREKNIQDLRNYRLPPRVQAKLYPALPRNTEAVPFDIFDYAMLFRDPATVTLIRTGETIGCFYIESPGMRSLLKRLNVDTFEMLTAASSVIRPGVAESGMMQEFIERHKNPKRRKYLVPQMEQILGETYGVMIYQEDVIKVAHHIAGLTLEDADLLRRAMSGKMRSHDAMNKLREKFFTSATSRGLTEPITRELWRQIESFAGYAFCKAHSASFALLSYQVAYLKAHHPAEFMAGVLSNGGGYYSASVYIWESKRLGLTVLPPCVNHSVWEYKGSGKEIRVGLMAVGNLSRSFSETIITERRNGLYTSLAEFMQRTRGGKEETAVLIKTGATDCFGKTRPTLMRLLDVYLRHRKLTEGVQENLFAFETTGLEKEVETTDEYSIEEKCRIEMETFGYMLSRHPLEFFPQYLNNPKIIRANTLIKYPGKKVTLAGWYMTSKRIKTKKGEIMKFLSLEDTSGTFEAILFPKTYEKYAEMTLSMGPFLVSGRSEPHAGNNVVVDTLELLAAAELKSILQKDSAENTYFGDEEKVTDEEFALVKSLGKERLLRAYAG